MTPSRFYLVFCLLVSPLHAQATETQASNTYTSPTYDINTAEPGGLYFATSKPGRVVRAPTLKADVTITVNGPLVHTRVTQHFKNTGNAWVEGMYTYPLPKGSAIDMLEMQVGDRLITGEIQEKLQAKRTFEKARSEGKRASLIIQKRPNIFTTRLANIGPGETIQVSIEYQDLIEPRDNVFELRFPMVVRPRYTPGIPLDTTRIAEGWGFDTDQVPDGASISQPYTLGRNPHHNPVTMNISLNAGFAIGDISSPSHAVLVDKRRKGADVKFTSTEVPADQDFILRWSPDSNNAPQIGVFTEASKTGNHHLVMVMPPIKHDDTKLTSSKQGRELVIILDKSGSMGGQAIIQAKAAVRRAVMRLKGKDTFNIIAFSSTAVPLFRESQRVTDETLHAALDFVDSIEADGGTEMSPALRVALEGRGAHPDTGKGMKQVIFVTDGAVGNEAALMEQIKKTLGDARLFTIGIGSAPNSYFMSEAAIWGRGTYINIAMNDNVLHAMNRLFRKIESPQITGIELKGAASGADIVPAKIPDLYTGEPIIALIKSEAGKRQDISLTGSRENTTWKRKVPATQNTMAKGIANLWARRKIDEINRDYIGRDSYQDTERRESILDIALSYHLVSEFTSLVAVDKTPARLDHELLFKRQVAANLPAGTEPAHFTLTGGAIKNLGKTVRMRQTATPSMFYLLLGLTLLLLASLAWFLQKRSELKA